MIIIFLNLEMLHFRLILCARSLYCCHIPRYWIKQLGLDYSTTWLISTIELFESELYFTLKTVTSVSIYRYLTIILRTLHQQHLRLPKSFRTFNFNFNILTLRYMKCKPCLLVLNDVTTCTISIKVYAIIVLWLLVSLEIVKFS